MEVSGNFPAASATELAPRSLTRSDQIRRALASLLAIGLAGCGFSGYLLSHDVFVVDGPVIGTALIYFGCVLLVLCTALGLVHHKRAPSA